MRRPTLLDPPEPPDHERDRPGSDKHADDHKPEDVDVDVLKPVPNGRPTRGPGDLLAAIAVERPGGKLPLTVQRGSQRLTLTVTLSAQPTQS
jgi:hypothetical protein